MKTAGPANAKVTVSADISETGLDMRAVVAHLTRKIKIIGLSD